MNDFKVIRYSKNDKKSWDSFVRTSKNATFLFYRDYMDYHNDRFDDYSLIVFHKNKIAALLPANKENELVCSHRGLTYGGILIQKNFSFTKYVKVVETILFFLNKNKISKLELKIMPSIYNQSLSEEVYAVSHYLDALNYKKEISLTIPISKEYNFSKLRKRGIKLGLKNNIEIIEFDSMSNFWNEILIPNLKTKHNTKPTHSLQEIVDLKNRFPQNIRQFNIFFKGELIGGTTIFETKTVAHAQYISGVEKYNNLGGLDLLFHFLITNNFKNKKYFNFGTSTIPTTNQINKGLLTWKQGFDTVPIIQDSILINTHKFEKLDALFV